MFLFKYISADYPFMDNHVQKKWIFYIKLLTSGMWDVSPSRIWVFSRLSPFLYPWNQVKTALSLGD